jgi:hypothetical protein
VLRLTTSVLKKCRFCGVPLDLASNWWLSSYRRHDYGCIQCLSAKNQRYRLNHANSMRKYNEAYYLSHKSTILPRRRSNHLKNREAELRQQAKYRRELKIKSIEKFGGQCVHCGQRELAFLTFGHLKDGDGAKHRREGTGQHDGAHFYLRLLRGELTEFPLQLECFNCNNGKRNVGLLRMKAIAAYGGKCLCCGESRASRLTLGHPNNDGGVHRKLVQAEKTFYRHIKAAGFPARPDGFNIEIQCWNCNLGAEMNSGICPHKTCTGEK